MLVILDATTINTVNQRVKHKRDCYRLKAKVHKVKYIVQKESTLSDHQKMIVLGYSKILPAAEL